VSDEGPGLSAAEQAMLFSKFTRLSIAGRAEVKGAGLGLAACRLLAELMGGSVGVDSRSGRGSRFFLRLPLVAGASTLAVATTPLFSLTVLVVEDTDYNAWAASAVLSKLDLPSERARTGAEALRLCAEKRFDVILLDRNLPDMDGTEVARRLRERETPGQQAILLAVTAYCTADDRAQCLAAGMNAFVGKPLTPEKLRKVLLGVGRRLLTTASVHVPPEAQSSAVDMSMLSYLSDGTDPGLQAQIDRFLVSLTEADAQLSAAFAASDFTALASGAHFVLSQSRMIGGAALAEAALCLEQAARARHHSTLGELLSRVRRELRAVMEALHQCHHAEQRG